MFFGSNAHRLQAVDKSGTQYNLYTASYYILTIGLQKII